MALKVPDVGLLKLLNDRIAGWGASVTLHLFTNNYTPIAGSVIGNFTEATFPGYVAQAIGAWGAAAMVGGRAKTIGSTITNTLSVTGGPYSIYGYYMTLGGVLIWAERDPNAPISEATAGDSYSVIPVFTQASEF